jgi:carboxyl-terminal processing protease
LPALKKGDKVPKDESFDFVEDESLKVMADLMQMGKP